MTTDFRFGSKVWDSFEDFYAAQIEPGLGIPPASQAINVEAAGADPTGGALSTSEIQNVWDTAPAHSTIWYPASASGQATYRVDSDLTHPNKPLHHRSPRGGAVIKRVGGAGNTWVSNGADGWTIDGLVLDGDYPNRTVGRVMQMVGSTGFMLQGVLVRNAPEMGMVFGAGCSGFLVHDFEVANTKVSGVWLGDGAGAVEDFTFRRGRVHDTNVSDAGGHSGFQAFSANPGGVQTVINRRGRFEDVDIYNYTARGWGMDFIYESEWWGCKARGSHTGEAMALTGRNNKVKGGQYGESTSAAGLLIWSWAGNDQDNRDTEIDGVYLPGPGSGNQGLAIVPGENNVTFRDIDIHGVRAKGWAYGVQHYNAGLTGTVFNASVVIHDCNLRDNTNAQTTAETSGWTLRDNVA